MKSAELRICFIVQKYFLYSSFWEGGGGEDMPENHNK